VYEAGGAAPSNASILGVSRGSTLVQERRLGLVMGLEMSETGHSFHWYVLGQLKVSIATDIGQCSSCCPTSELEFAVGI
jgi:hypothetical protein